ncbi:MarR family winged helix-turn-helix transcriptional regulator [Anaeromyxobacter sp. Fw109-5]|uniref:MarR family winged helix-turn-helix transcriptional regulator n=1 Tax=Anaeromyxobacter sp. (strain Fw109-5) TaxID=404589 RepID=UPI0000ED6F05|nr:MarR family transcriptional regulator [Anaeromyxobacter sp. Fw109-5]ABS28321.1 transcriptional regulator, MarR family [Anaeromyxobacter sp. Fw109-5]
MRNTSDAGLRREARALRGRVIALARHRSLRDPVAASCADLELTPPQIHALLWLGHDGPLTMGELARRVAVTEKTVTGIVDRLERDGHLKRERDAEDRRLVRARLTSGGEQLFRRIDADIEDRITALLGALDLDDRRALTRILDKLVARLAAPEEGGRR